jgi:hypothetical protein
MLMLLMRRWCIYVSNVTNDHGSASLANALLTSGTPLIFMFPSMRMSARNLRLVDTTIRELDILLSILVGM